MKPLALHLPETALVLIDLQVGIVGMPAVPRSGIEVVANAAKLAVRFREAGACVVLVHVGFSADGRDLLKPEADVEPKLPQFPPNWMDFVPELKQAPTDLVIKKRQWGAFHGTELDLQLRRRGIRKIVLGGVATQIGVESTARAAFEHGYSQVFVEDTMATTGGEEAHLFPIRNIFPRIGQVRSTEEVLAACAAWAS